MNTYLKLSLDKRRAKSDGSFPIILRITHLEKTTGIATGYSVLAESWDEGAGKIKRGCKTIENVARVNNLLDRLRLDSLDKITRLHERGGLTSLSVVELKGQLSQKSSKAGFVAYTQGIVAEMRNQNRIGNARYYGDVLREVMLFRKKQDFAMPELTYAFLVRFKNWYLGRGLERNGLNVYMRGIKAIYNRAIKDGLVERDSYPFINYQIKAMPTQKRAISRDAIQSLTELDLSQKPMLAQARSIFLLSFYTHGMPFVDLAFLKVSDIVGDRIQYRRRKTKRFLDIKISAAALPIIDAFRKGKPADAFVMPIIKRNGLEDQYKDMQWARKRYNKRLKELAVLSGIEDNLTSYVSRHSFASIANNLAVPVTAIQEMMGHEKVSTTQVYLAGLNKNVLADYNDLITGPKTS